MRINLFDLTGTFVYQLSLSDDVPRPEIICFRSRFFCSAYGMGDRVRVAEVQNAIFSYHEQGVHHVNSAAINRLGG